MKVICQILAAVALFGTVLCSGEGGDVGVETQGGGDRNCGITLEPDETEEDLRGLLSQMTFNCLRQHKKTLDDQLYTMINPTTEKMRETIKKFCERTPAFNNCTDRVPAQVHDCVDEAVLEQVRVDRETLQKMVRVSCKDDGDRLVTIYQEGKKLKTDHPLQRAEVDKCFKSAQDQVMENIFKVNNANATERRVAINNVMINVRECFISMPEQASVFSQAFVSIMDDMLAKDK